MLWNGNKENFLKKQVEDEIVKKLEGVLSIYKERLDEQEFGILQEIVIGGVVIAEKEAFIAGVYYGIQWLRWYPDTVVSR